MLFRRQLKQNVHSTSHELHLLPDSQLRILILAPHPDDETLAAGGLIASAMDVHPAPLIRVIVATNGDASYLTAISGGMHSISHSNFRRLAVIRQQESLSALIFLGLKAQQIRFWGFPDRGLDAIWQRDWMTEVPYSSPTTGFDHAEQALNSPILPYTGASLMRLLQKELSEFRPTTVILPHPEDAHSDHRALARFTLLAATLDRQRMQSTRLELLAYRMWQRGGLWMKEARAIPKKHPGETNEESRPNTKTLDLTTDVFTKKALALECYASQRWAANRPIREAVRNHTEIFYPMKPYSFIAPPVG